MNGIVHGVVVHTIRNSFSFPLTGNLTKIELSFTFSYSSSCFDSAVPQSAHQCIVFSPSYKRLFSCAFLTSHQVPSIKLFFTDIYAFSKSIQTPKRRKSLFISLRLSRENFLHSLTNLSTPYSGISSLCFKPSLASTLSSVGSPCMSYPARSHTSKPFMRLYLCTTSFKGLFHAVPRCMLPDVYGGPSRK